MRFSTILSTLAVLTTAGLAIVNGAAPTDVNKVVNADDLVSEARAKAKKLKTAVESDASFARALENKTVATDGGTIACLAQALVEHKAAEKSGVNATALRDAALQLSRTKKRDEATAALASVAAALEGKGEGGEKEYAWNKLINMHRMMEEMEYRQARLRRSLRRPRNLKKDSAHATVLTVLALAMEADAHEVKDKKDLPLWNKWSQEYRDSMSKLSAAMREGKADAAKEIFNASGKVCTECHKTFRD